MLTLCVGIVQCVGETIASSLTHTNLETELSGEIYRVSFMQCLQHARHLPHSVCPVAAF